jgi:hypothetical protein
MKGQFMFSNSDTPENLRYNIVRFYRNHNRRIIARNVSYDAAREHCSNPETSSRTCTKPHNKARTRKMGDWFDGFERV